MEERTIKIEYDAMAEDALNIAISILTNLGVEYEVIDGDVVTIKYRWSVVS